MIRQPHPQAPYFGNKGANLITMERQRVPVPDAYYISVQEVQEGFHLEPKFVGHVLDSLDGPGHLIARSSPVESMPGMLESVPMVEKTPEALAEALRQVTDSWDAPRAQQYRRVTKKDSQVNMGIVVQQMVRTDLGGVAGVLFTHDPQTGLRKLSGSFAENALGSAVVDGKADARPLEDLARAVGVEGLVELARMAGSLCGEYPQDIEFGFDDARRMYLFQTRDLAMSPQAKLAYWVHEWKTGNRPPSAILPHMDPEWLETNVSVTADTDAEPAVVSPHHTHGFFVGNVVRDREKLDARSVWVTDITTVEDLECMRRAGAFVVRSGSPMSHPAIVARQLGKTCVLAAGAQADALPEGAEVTVAGGRVWLGRHEPKTVEAVAVPPELLAALKENS